MSIDSSPITQDDPWDVAFWPFQGVDQKCVTVLHVSNGPWAFCGAAGHMEQEVGQRSRPVLVARPKAPTGAQGLAIVQVFPKPGQKELGFNPDLLVFKRMKPEPSKRGRLLNAGEAARSWTIQAELTAAMWDFARKNWKTNIAFQGGRTTRPFL